MYKVFVNDKPLFLTNHISKETDFQLFLLESIDIEQLIVKIFQNKIQLKEIIKYIEITNSNFTSQISQKKQDIKKNIILKEVANTNHEIERLKSRFSVFTPEDLSNADKVKILRNISLLNSLELNPRESYGVRLGDFQINPNSKYYFKIYWITIFLIF